jgi:hypothetical protein
LRIGRAAIQSFMPRIGRACRDLVGWVANYSFGRRIGRATATWSVGGVDGGGLQADDRRDGLFNRCVASGQACGQAQRRRWRLRWRWHQLWPVADRIFGRRLNCADGLQIRRKGANWTVGRRIERRIGRSSGVSDGLAAFCSIGRRIRRSGSESRGELDGRAA